MSPLCLFILQIIGYVLTSVSGIIGTLADLKDSKNKMLKSLLLGFIVLGVVISSVVFFLQSKAEEQQFNTILGGFEDLNRETQDNLKMSKRLIELQYPLRRLDIYLNMTISKNSLKQIDLERNDFLKYLVDVLNKMEEEYDSKSAYVSLLEYISEGVQADSNSLASFLKVGRDSGDYNTQKLSIFLNILNNQSTIDFIEKYFPPPQAAVEIPKFNIQYVDKVIELLDFYYNEDTERLNISVLIKDVHITPPTQSFSISDLSESELFVGSIPAVENLEVRTKINNREEEYDLSLKKSIEYGRIFIFSNNSKKQLLNLQ